MPKTKKPTPQDIYDMLTGDGSHLPSNVELAEGKLDGKKVHFIVATNKDDEDVPIALLLDDKARKLVEALVDEREDEEDDEDEEPAEHEEDTFEP